MFKNKGKNSCVVLAYNSKRKKYIKPWSAEVALMAQVEMLAGSDVVAPTINTEPGAAKMHNQLTDPTDMLYDN